MKLPTQNLLIRIISVVLFIAVLALVWDAGWHISVGRDTFWEPPHIMLYSAVLTAIVAGLFGLYVTARNIWRYLVILLFLLPLSAPFDELWHRLFGVENLSSPLALWSPPHVLLILSLIGSLALLLRLVSIKETLIARYFLGSLIFASILGLSFLLVVPFLPTGPYELFGFFGAGIVAFVLVFILLIAQYWINAFASATLAMTFFLLISSVGPAVVQKIAEGVAISPYQNPPFWLIVFSYLSIAAFMDMFKKAGLLLRGTVSGFIWAVMLFGFSSAFFEPQFQYTELEAITSILSGIIGGIIAGVLAQYAISRFKHKRKA